jgi:cytochrome c oxidase subunit 4
MGVILSAAALVDPRLSAGGARSAAERRVSIATALRVSMSDQAMSDHSTGHSKSPLVTYFAVWAALLAGTFLTYEAAKLDLGHFNAAVALIIATTKALLVALFFMHLRGASEKLLKLVVISTIFFLLLLLALSMADYGTRLWR